MNMALQGSGDVHNPLLLQESSGEPDALGKFESNSVQRIINSIPSSLSEQQRETENLRQLEELEEDEDVKSEDAVDLDEIYMITLEAQMNMGTEKQHLLELYGVTFAGLDPMPLIYTLERMDPQPQEIIDITNTEESSVKTTSVQRKMRELSPTISHREATRIPQNSPRAK